MHAGMSGLNLALLVLGIVILAVAAILLITALSMVNYMGYYHCMGMMCGPMIYYPLILPVTLMAIGTVLLILPLTILRNYGINNTGTAKVNAGGDATAETPGISDILKLLPSQEREVLEYVIKAGGEVFQYQIMRDLGLSKVRAWRIVRRLEEKGLVEVSKVKGRNVVKLRKKSGV
ncbi:MAG: MarR family transcriptional regulator [Vulcanisaeta sp.]|jgi:biotin operon repressor/uncharacterized membrane protein